MPEPATAQLPVRLYFAAAAALAVSTVLPWFNVSVGSELSELVPGGLSSSSRPSGGGMLYLLLIATAYARRGLRAPPAVAVPAAEGRDVGRQRLAGPQPRRDGQRAA